MKRAGKKRSRRTPQRRAVPGYRPRVILKFHNELELPYDDSVDGHLDRLSGQVWRKLKARFPGISIRILFNAVTPSRMRQIVEEAMRLNRNYRPPNFLTYFVVDLPAAIAVNDLVGELQPGGWSRPPTSIHLEMIRRPAPTIRAWEAWLTSMRRQME